MMLLLTGKWQKRWVVMDTHALEDDENYFISYFHNPEDTKPRQSFPLANTSLLMSGGNSFTLTFADDSNIVLGADNNEQVIIFLLHYLSILIIFYEYYFRCIIGWIQLKRLYLLLLIAKKKL